MTDRLNFRFTLGYISGCERILVLTLPGVQAGVRGESEASKLNRVGSNEGRGQET